MLQIKDGVKVRDIKPEMLLAIVIVHAAFSDNQYATTITSVRDSKHSQKSLHRYGYAVDFATKHLDRYTLKKVVPIIKAALGADYDVILESEGANNEHLHVEFDPVA